MSFSVNLLLDVNLSIKSSFLASIHIALLAISLHLISECFFTSSCNSFGIDKVILTIFHHLFALCVYTYIKVSVVILKHIDIRLKVGKHDNWIVRLLTKSDYLYDSLTDLPDFHCSSVRDFE